VASFQKVYKVMWAMTSKTRFHTDAAC